MATTQDMIGRLGLLGLALAVCVLKFFYTFTLELNTTGGEAAYILMLHDTYVLMTAWTALLAILVITTGSASIKDMGNLKFLHSSYFLVMAAVAAFSIVNDAGAMSNAVGAHNWILLFQFGGEIALVLLMGQQLLHVITSLGQKTLGAAQNF